MSRELMSQVVSDFGKEIGAQLEVDDEAYCCLVVGDNMQVHLQFNEHFDGMILYSEIGEIPNLGKKEILRHYVMENGAPESRSLTFMYNSETNQVGMARLINKEFLNLDIFKKVLEKFIERHQKEYQNVEGYTRGELPQDKIQFAQSGEDNAPQAGEGDPQFMRM